MPRIVAPGKRPAPAPAPAAASARRLSVPERVRRERVVDDYMRLASEIQHFRGMVTALGPLAWDGPEAWFGFVVHLRAPVHGVDGKIQWRETHPIRARFPARYPWEVFVFWYDVAAAGGVLAWHPNVAAHGNETPGYICLWDTEGMKSTGARMPLQYGVSLLVDQLSFRRANPEDPHGLLNSRATAEYMAGKWPPIPNPRLPVVNLDPPRPTSGAAVVARRA